MKRILLIPPKVTALLTRNHGFMYKVVLMILVYITALYTKHYTGPYQDLINNHVGGIFYVFFGALLLSVIFRQIRPRNSALLALSLTCLVECIQYFRFPFMLKLAHNQAMAYLFGNSFNPVDFMYYFAGAALAWFVLILLSPVTRTTITEEASAF